MRAAVEHTDDVRFGLYLRPSLAMSRAQVEIHDLVARQYGSMCAGRFMPHATIKGFFRSDATVDELVGALDPVMVRSEPFQVVNGGIVPFGGSGSIAFDIHHDRNGQPNQPLVHLHHDVFSALTPLIRPDCDFTPKEGKLAGFRAHLTVMMGDIPRGLEAEILEFLRDAGPVGPPEFLADRFHLVAVRSQDWDGAWWETMQWTLLHSWRPGGERVRVLNPTWNVPAGERETAMQSGGWYD